MACGNEYTFSGSGTPGLNGLTFVKDQYGGYAAGSYYMFSPGGTYWRVTVNGGTLLYVTETFPNGTVCPDEAVWVVGSNGVVTGTGAANAPTVSIPVIDPIAVRDNKYATATETGAVRFRRLVNLGYV